MQYLFFDIECATCAGGGRLCEFGYVLTDGELNKTLSENLLIDPDCRFDWYVLKNVLNYPERTYRKSPKLTEIYQTLTALLTAPDTLVVGHTTLGDCEHIGDDCIRYGLAVPSFDYVDIVELYKQYTDTPDQTALGKMCEALGIEVEGNAHSADVDALMTMRVCKALCEKQGCSFETLLHNCKNARGTFKDYEKRYRMKKAVDDYRDECKANGTLATDEQNRNVYTYVKGVKPQGKVPEHELNGKKVYIPEIYRWAHYTQTINLIRLIASVGGAVVLALNKCDIFVDCVVRTASGEEIFCKSKEKAERAVRSGKHIEFITFAELLKKLNATDDDINKPFKINFAAMAKKEQPRAVYNDGAAATSLGELLKPQKDRQ